MQKFAVLAPTHGTTKEFTMKSSEDKSSDVRVHTSPPFPAMSFSFMSGQVFIGRSDPGSFTWRNSMKAVSKSTLSI